jgi:hypothetical protein
VDWGLVAGLLEEGWRMVAPKRAMDRLEAGARPPRGRGQKA